MPTDENITDVVYNDPDATPVYGVLDIIGYEDRIELNSRIAVYTITKNEATMLDRMLTSVLDADQIVVIDTGSTDNTMNKLNDWKNKYPDKIIIGSCQVIPWRFDMARNYALMQISEDIDFCVSIDTDEVVQEGWYAALQNIIKNNPRVNRIDFRYVWSSSSLLTFYRDRIHSRFGFMWVTPTHEVLSYYGAEELKCIVTDDIVVLHLPEPRGKRDDIYLLQVAIKERPTDARSSFYLGREYTFYNRWYEAINELERYLSLPDSCWNIERASAHILIGRSHEKLGNYTLAETHYNQAIADAPEMRETHLALAQFYFNNKIYFKVIECCKNALLIAEPPGNYYLIEPACYTHYPHDLCAISLYQIAHLSIIEAERHSGIAALKSNYCDPRLVNNDKFIQRIVKIFL